MNIFATYQCPVKSARFLDTKRVNKMILESAQMLSTAINECGGQAPYKSTHRNHPSNIWARETVGNYLWLLDHMEALAQEYYRRRGKWHKSYREYFQDFLANAVLLPQGAMTDFANCARNKQQGVDYTDVKDVHKAYRLYLRERWSKDKLKPVWG